VIITERRQILREYPNGKNIAQALGNNIWGGKTNRMHRSIASPSEIQFGVTLTDSGETDRRSV
jgi:hypothetical protein